MKFRIIPILGLLFLGSAQADQFEHYTYPVLLKAIEDGTAKEHKELTSDQLSDLGGTLNDTSSCFIIVQTNEKRLAKLLVQPARQKTSATEHATMLLIDQYTCYKGNSERAIQATGKSTHLYPGLRLNLEFGQIVPESLIADIQVIGKEKEPNNFTLKPVKEAKLYVLTKAIPGVIPKKGGKLVVGEAFEVRFFEGKYKLYDDGRRTGDLRLNVNESGEISGTYTSDKDGREYDVSGKVGNPKHQISFSIKYPAFAQSFNGLMFTGNGKAIAGTTKINDREAAFYAERAD
jgi:hypothetical protein